MVSAGRAVASPHRCFSSASPPASELAQWQSFNAAGLKFLSEGAFDRASLLFMSAMREPAVLNTVYQYLSLSNLGISFRHLGKHAEAKDVLLQSLNALKGFSQIHDGMLANLHREAALCCEALGQNQEAESMLDLSLHYYAQYAIRLESAAAAGSGAAAGTAAAASAPNEQRKHLLEKAGTHYSLALLIHKSALAARGDVPPQKPGQKFVNPPAVAQRLQDSGRHYADALQLMRALHGRDAKSQGALLAAPVLASLGTLQADLGDDKAAMASIMEALEIYKEHNDPRLLPLLDAYMALLQKQNPALHSIVEQTKDAPQ
jgi:tetratricopeptide (TPR) repeat protein